MPDDITDIAAFYDGDPLTEHTRLERHQLEYDMTLRYLNQYLPARGKILELGAGSGRYTLELAKRGYTITAVDLSASLLSIAKQTLAAEGFDQRVQFLVTDVRTLQLPDRDYHAITIMGPLYHLIHESDRKLVLQNAFDHLRAGGIIFTAFTSRFAGLSDLIKKMPEWIENQPRAASLLAEGKRPDDEPRGGFRAYFARPPEIPPLHESVGFETIALAAMEPVVGADDESYNRLIGTQRQLWLDILFNISQEPTILGASRHLLYIGKKP